MEDPGAAALLPAARPDVVVLPQAGAAIGCDPPPDRSTAEAALQAELDRWSAPAPAMDRLDPLVLAEQVTAVVQAVGVHHLAEPVLDGLAVVRDRHGTRDALLDAFLDCVLAKRDGRYWNRTYLLLPVLEGLVDGPMAPLDPIGMAALLAADVIRRELCAARRGAPAADLGRPDPRTLRTRVRHATRFMTAHLGTATAADLLGAASHAPSTTTLLAQLPTAPDPRAAAWFAVTVQPVSTVHDEVFFIRALQAHEMVFTTAARRIQQATNALRDGRPLVTAVHVHDVRVLIDRAASLFRLVATIRPAAFHAFRDRTDGASAIQSEQYKRFELRCAIPPPNRIGAAAFRSVPTVLAEAATGPDSLAGAYADACEAGHRGPELAVVADELRALEAAHARWKRAHLQLATRVLGDARGSGYTAGVPYLREWVGHRLFWALPELAGA